jgi:Zn-dependent protease with chaperone function
MRQAKIASCVVLTGVLAVPVLAQLKEFKPGFNLFSTQQDIQLGQEAAAEVEKTMTVVHNPELEGYLTRIGGRLAASKRAGKFPYKFQVINDKTINAFALPGGPMFVHTGLIAAADNESQLAGVLAHEMSHVALRHGTNQASKANLIQLPAMLATGVLGQGGGLWGSLAQLGIGLGTQSVLLKYSRDAEKQADLNGAQMMNDAGYDPVQMARFFEKLEAEGSRDNSMVANFFADHPTPGRRVDYVQEQNKYLPKIQPREFEPEALPKMKQAVAALPPPAPRKTAGPGGGQEALPPSEVRPSGKFKQFTGQSFRLNYPENWDMLGAPGASMVTIAPKGALIAGPNNQTQIGYGMIVSYYIPQGGKADLNRDTAALVQNFMQGSSGLRRGKDPQRTVQVAGVKALMTPLESPSPYHGETEVDMLVTLARPEGLFYLLFIAPRSEWDTVTRDFNNILGSIQFQ